MMVLPVTGVEAAGEVGPGGETCDMSAVDTSVPFTDRCYHQGVWYSPVTSQYDVIIVPPASPYALRDLELVQESVDMWEEGIKRLGEPWLATGLQINDYTLGMEQVPPDALADPEVVILLTTQVNPALLFGVAVNSIGPCATLSDYDSWLDVPGFHLHDGSSWGSILAAQSCPATVATNPVCYVVNTNFMGLPSYGNGRSMMDLISHEVGHCLTLGHVGDADTEGTDDSVAYPHHDILSYEGDGIWEPTHHCPSNLNVRTLEQAFRHHFLGGTASPVAPNPDGYIHMHPDDWGVDAQCENRAASIDNVDPLLGAGGPDEDEPTTPGGTRKDHVVAGPATLYFHRASPGAIGTVGNLETACINNILWMDEDAPVLAGNPTPAMVHPSPLDGVAHSHNACYDPAEWSEWPMRELADATLTAHLFVVSGTMNAVASTFDVTLYGDRTVLQTKRVTFPASTAPRELVVSFDGISTPGGQRLSVHIDPAGVGAGGDAAVLYDHELFPSRLVIEQEEAPLGVLVDVPATGTVGQPVDVSGAATGGDGAYSYAWTTTGQGAFGDANAASTTYTPGTTGDHVLRLTVTDGVGATAWDESTLAAAEGEGPIIATIGGSPVVDGDAGAVAPSGGKVLVEGTAPGFMPNEEPVAGFDAACQGLTCSFTDTSTDDGAIVAWSWDFDDDGSEDSAAQHPQHTFPAEGTFDVRLAVTDDRGASASATQPVTVAQAGATHWKLHFAGDRAAEQLAPTSGCLELPKYELAAQAPALPNSKKAYLAWSQVALGCTTRFIGDAPDDLSLAAGATVDVWLGCDSSTASSPWPFSKLAARLYVNGTAQGADRDFYFGAPGGMDFLCTGQTIKITLPMARTVGAADIPAGAEVRLDLQAFYANGGNGAPVDATVFVLHSSNDHPSGIRSTAGTGDAIAGHVLLPVGAVPMDAATSSGSGEGTVTLLLDGVEKATVDVVQGEWSHDLDVAGLEGTHTVSAYFSKDGVDSATTSATFTIASTLSVDAGSDQDATSGETVQLHAQASEPATYAWEQVAGPTVPLQGADTADASFQAPFVSQETLLEFEVTATAGQQSARDSIVVTVRPTSSPQVSITSPADGAEVPNSGFDVGGAYEPAGSGPAAAASLDLAVAWQDPAEGGNGDYVFIDDPAAGVPVAGPTTLSGEAGTSPTDPRPACETDCGGGSIVFGEPQPHQLRPGDLSSVCTLNFLFEHQGRYFFGSAAHCAATGSNTDTNGCTTRPKAIGSPEVLEGRGTATITATLAYSSWATMQRVGETNGNICFGNDFALFEIDEEDFDKIHPAVRMYGGPTGLGRIEDMGMGDKVHGYGRSFLHDDSFVFGAERSLLNPKQGVHLGSANGGWSHWVYFLPQGVPGDSGSGHFDAQGRALGVASTISAAGASNNYANLQRALQYMQDKEGWAPTLVTWDEFDPEPRLAAFGLAQEEQGPGDALAEVLAAAPRAHAGVSDASLPVAGGLVGEVGPAQFSDADGILEVRLPLEGELDGGVPSVSSTPVSYEVQFTTSQNGVDQPYRLTYEFRAADWRKLLPGDGFDPMGTVVGADVFELFVDSAPDSTGVSSICPVQADLSQSEWTPEAAVFRIPLAEFDHDNRPARGGAGCEGFTRNGRGLEAGDVITGIRTGVVVTGGIANLGAPEGYKASPDHTVQSGQTTPDSVTFTVNGDPAGSAPVVAGAWSHEIDFGLHAPEDGLYTVVATFGTATDTIVYAAPSTCAAPASKIVVTMGSVERCTAYDPSSAGTWSVSFDDLEGLSGQQTVVARAYDAQATLLDEDSITVTIGAPDSDGDGHADDQDNCPSDANPGQADSDGDGIGDACDTQDNGDDDGDSVENWADLCPGTPSGGAVDADGCTDTQRDADGDGVPDIDDVCPGHDDMQDGNGNGIPDGCDQRFANQETKDVFIAEGQQTFFTAIVPPGVSAFTITMADGPSHDVDLAVRFGERPAFDSLLGPQTDGTPLDPDHCYPFSEADTERCSFPNPRAGTWHIGLDGFSGAGIVQLTVSWPEASDGGPDADGDGLADDREAFYGRSPGSDDSGSWYFDPARNVPALPARNTWLHSSTTFDTVYHTLSNHRIQAFGGDAAAPGFSWVVGAGSITLASNGGEALGALLVTPGRAAHFDEVGMTEVSCQGAKATLYVKHGSGAAAETAAFDVGCHGDWTADTSGLGAITEIVLALQGEGSIRFGQIWTS